VNEFLEISLRKPDGRPLAIRRQTTGGIELDEADAIERAVGIQVRGRSEVTERRMRRIAQVKNWAPGVFRLNLSVEHGKLLIRGVDANALPPGDYALGLEIEEARVQPRRVSVRIPQDGHATASLEISFDERQCAPDLSGCCAGIGRVLDDSRIDEEAGRQWLANTTWRSSRKACLLNILAALSATPSKRNTFLEDVQGVFRVFNDRCYMKVDRRLLTALETLAADPKHPVYAEGEPHAPIHGRLLEALPEPREVRDQFRKLLSFRAEGSPSLQTVIAVPPANLSYTYAEFDLDLGNPLQDVLGFAVHMGELFSGKPTNHLDMRKRLAGTKASEFLYYTVRS
jgi:hypothetical protein